MSTLDRVLQIATESKFVSSGKATSHAEAAEHHAKIAKMLGNEGHYAAAEQHLKASKLHKQASLANGSSYREEAHRQSTIAANRSGYK